MTGTETKDEFEDRRRAAIDALTDRYSRDELPVEEYERLVADIHRARDGAELAVVADIVAGAKGGPRAYAEDGPVSYLRQEDVQNSVAVLSERRLAGDWLRKRNVSAISFLGSQVVDFRDVELPRGRVTLEVFALLGSVEILVPDGLPVRMEATPIAGDATVGRGVETREGADGPLLVVTGSVLLGSVSVKRR